MNNTDHIMPNPVTLGMVARVRLGYQARSRIQASTAGSHRIIQVKDLDSHDRLDRTNLIRFIPEQKPDLYTVLRNDVLYLAKGIRHLAVWVDTDLENTVASGAFHILRPNPELVHPGFLAWWLNQTPARTALKAQASGTNLPFVSKAQLENLELSIPPLDVQAKVAKINTLYARERDLLDRITQRRQQLIAAICTAACETKE